MTDPKPNPPGYVRWATRTLEEAGYETWVVGGAIRNTLLGLPTPEWDLATRAPPKVVQRLFPRTFPVGIEHGTVGVLTRGGTLLEVTTFRKDVETFGRKAVVEFAETLQEDLSRRDFTVNAMAWHALSGEYLDPFHGRKDLETKLLRTVGDPHQRFKEDYLRVLRALRFSGRLQFVIEDATWDALCASTGHLGVLSPERVREELLKILSEAPCPSAALSLYQVTGVLAALYPEVAAVGKCLRAGANEDIWSHSLLLTDTLPASRPLLRLAALFQGVGSPQGEGMLPRKEALPSGESDIWARSRDRTVALMMRLRFSNAHTQFVSELIHSGLEPPLELNDPSSLRRWLNMADPDNLRSLGRVWLAKARLDQRRFELDPRAVLSLLRSLRSEVRSGRPLRLSDLELDGRDLISLGLKPGPHFGDILSSAMDRVLEDPELNRRDVLKGIVMEGLRAEEVGPK